MNLEQTLMVIGQLRVRHLDKALTEVERCIVRGTWHDESFEDIAANTAYSYNYIQKNIAPKLWNFLSKTLSTSLSKQNFKEFFEKQNFELFSQLHNISCIQVVNQYGDLLETSNFVGRKNELDELESLLISCRSVVICGSGGVGKSSLASFWIDQRIESVSRWTNVIWVSAYVNSIQTLIYEIVEGTGNTLINENDLFASFYHFLKENKCLLCIDSAEELFENHTQNWVDSRKFLKTTLEAHSSCIVFISREPIKELHAHTEKSNQIGTLKLAGMNLEDAKLLLRQNNIKDEESWDWLIHQYRGNPLALKIVASYINEYFGGSVISFQGMNTIFLCMELESILNEQCLRLSVEANKLIKYFANGYYQKTPKYQFSFDSLKDEFTESPDILLRCIRELEDKSFLERTSSKEGILWSVPPIIRKFIYSTFCKVEPIYESVH